MPTIPAVGLQLTGDLVSQLAEPGDPVLFGDAWQRRQLPAREDSPATAATRVALPRTGQLPFHRRRARANGIGREALAGRITRPAFRTGGPCAASAIAILRQCDGAEAP